MNSLKKSPHPQQLLGLEQLSIRFPSPAFRLAPDHEKLMSHGAGIYFSDFLSLQAVHVADFNRISTVPIL